MYYSLIIVFVGVLSALACFFFLRQKNRLIWTHLFETRKEINRQASEIKHEFETALKQLAMAGIKQTCRLPLAMPSQQGEDLLIWNYFNKKMNGYYVEVGAFDGFTHSNTYFFEAIGWNGILVEAGPEFYSKCVVARPHSHVINAAISSNGGSIIDFTVAEGNGDVGAFSYVGQNADLQKRVEVRGGITRVLKVPAMTLNQILSNFNQIKEPIDFISIDVEGMELDVLKSMNFNEFRPRVFLMEDNTGGKDTSVHDFLEEMGYEQRYIRGQNIFYVKKEDIGNFSWV